MGLVPILGVFLRSRLVVMVYKGLLRCQDARILQSAAREARAICPPGKCLKEIHSLLATTLCLCPCSKLNSRFCPRMLSFHPEV